MDHLWHASSYGGGEDCCEHWEACPSAPPQEGDACDFCDAPTACSYPGTCGGAAASCGTDGKWHVAIGDCPPPPVDACSGNGTQTACEGDSGCRWLTPGCSPNGLTVTGCFLINACSPATCQPGTTCQTVSYDPCFGKSCDACGADTTVCLQSAL